MKKRTYKIYDKDSESFFTSTSYAKKREAMNSVKKEVKNGANLQIVTYEDFTPIKEEKLIFYKKNQQRENFKSLYIRFTLTYKHESM